MQLLARCTGKGGVLGVIRAEIGRWGLILIRNEDFGAGRNRVRPRTAASTANSMNTESVFGFSELRIFIFHFWGVG